jgi:hypothetical protein
LIELLDAVNPSDDYQHQQQDEIGLGMVREVSADFLEDCLSFGMRTGVGLFEGRNRIAPAV